jgi:integrase
MKMLELIRHYERIKSLHQPLSPSLGEKVVQLRDAFGQLPADASGLEIVVAAKTYWPSAADNTIKRNLGQLRAVLRMACKTGLLSAVPHIEMPHVFDVRDVDLTTVEMGHILDFIEVNDPKIYPAVLLLMHTGGRLGEVYGINPAEDCTKEGLVFRKPRARKSKTAQRVVPYTERLSLHVRANVTPLPLSRCYKSPKDLGNRVRSALTRACESLGLPVIRVHDLRHCFAALVADGGGDIADISALLGHSSIGTTMRYRGLVKQKAQRILTSIT